MGSSTPSASCPPCSDTPLAVTTSVITFLTFLYALTVGLFYYYRIARSSPEEIQKYIEALSSTLREIETMDVLVPITRERHAEHEALKIYKTEVDSILDQLETQLMELNSFVRSVRRFEEHGSPSSRSARWFQRLDRMRYLISRQKLQQNAAIKDRLMADLRHIEQRAERIVDDRVEKEHREKQETMQLEQVQMLESILRRVIRLEASVRTSTKDKTSWPDPPPESTD